MVSLQDSRPLKSVKDGESFDSLNPSTGSVVGTFRIHGDDEVRQAIVQAREASIWWQSLGYGGRIKHLNAWKSRIARRMHELADLITRENGKPHADAILEITLALDHITWASSNARRVLGPRSVFPGLLAMNNSATVEYQPLGVVGVIGPWNYPIFTPIGSIGYALAAGNAVVFKPSEFTPAIGSWLVDAWEEAVPAGRNVFKLITGFGETGAALCRGGVDKIAFTGSAATGRRVMGACAENLIPVLMECGGKDALIVDDDADLSAAADAALWGGMSNGGQTCIGIERVYATEKIYDRFVTLLTERAESLHPGSETDSSWGPPTMPSQLDIIRKHIGDALEKGGRAVVGGLSGVRSEGVEATILVDVPEDAAAVRDETFGPTLTVSKVRNAEEALELANASSYGLGGAIFTGSRSRGIELARRMRSGMTSVNSVITFASVAGLPFGGVGESGFGRIHGPDGLREFTRAKAITAQRFALPVNLLSFNRPEKAADVVAKLMGLLYGRKG